MAERLTVMITGATGGIGRALAVEYAQSGVTLILLARNQPALDELATQCQNLGASVHTYRLDLSSPESARTLAESIVREHSIDLVISNAGITSSVKNGEAESWSTIDAVLSVNLNSAIAITHPIMLDMQRRRKGHIAYISSLAAYYGMSVTPAYSASKAGLRGYAEAMRVLLKKDCVSVSLVTPGFVKTNMSDQFPADKPFMISAKAAAHIIKKGLDKKKSVITFPLLLSLGMRCLPILPAAFSDYILQKLKY